MWPAVIHYEVWITVNTFILFSRHGTVFPDNSRNLTALAKNLSYCVISYLIGPRNSHRRLAVCSDVDGPRNVTHFASRAVCTEQWPYIGEINCKLRYLFPFSQGSLKCRCIHTTLKSPLTVLGTPRCVLFSSFSSRLSCLSRADDAHYGDRAMPEIVVFLLYCGYFVKGSAACHQTT